jgi:hypothetical protein
MKWILSTALIAAVAPGALAQRISTKWSSAADGCDAVGGY